MESVADRLKKVMLSRDVADVETFFSRIDKRKHPIVRRDEMIPVGSYHNRTPCRTHARIHHHQMHGARGKVRVSLSNGQCTVENIKSLHRVTDVHDLGFRNDVQDDALNRSYKVIAEPKIGGQSNDRPLRQSSCLALRNQDLPGTLESNPM